MKEHQPTPQPEPEREHSEETVDQWLRQFQRNHGLAPHYRKRLQNLSPNAIGLLQTTIAEDGEAVHLVINKRMNRLQGQAAANRLSLIVRFGTQDQIAQAREIREGGKTPK